MSKPKTIERSALVRNSAEQMFNLVNDIEAYPEFMEGCRDAKVLERGDGWLTASLDLAKAGIHNRFTTRNTLHPPERINMELVDGPFKVLHGSWLFEPLDDRACKVTFRLEYQFSNILMGLAAGKMLDSLASDQVRAVCERARTLYPAAD